MRGAQVIVLFLAVACSLSAAEVRELARIDVEGFPNFNVAQAVANFGPMEVEAYTLGFQRAAAEIRNELLNAHDPVSNAMATLINIDIDAPIRAAVIGSNGRILQLDNASADIDTLDLSRSLTIGGPSATVTAPIAVVDVDAPISEVDVLAALMDVPAETVVEPAPAVVDFMCQVCEEMCADPSTLGTTECSDCVARCGTTVVSDSSDNELITALQSDSEADVVAAIIEILDQQTPLVATTPATVFAPTVPAVTTTVDVVSGADAVSQLLAATDEVAVMEDVLATLVESDSFCRVCREVCPETDTGRIPECERCFLACSQPAPSAAETVSAVVSDPSVSAIVQDSPAAAALILADEVDDPEVAAVIVDMISLDTSGGTAAAIDIMTQAKLQRLARLERQIASLISIHVSPFDEALCQPGCVRGVNCPVQCPPPCPRGCRPGVNCPPGCAGTVRNSRCFPGCVPGRNCPGACGRSLPPQRIVHGGPARKHAPPRPVHPAPQHVGRTHGYRPHPQPYRR